MDFKVYALPKTVPAVIHETFSRTFSYVETMYRTLFDLVTGKVSFQYLSGPVGTSKVIKQAADYGIMSVLSLTSLISINLAVFNMLPFPALDGGRIVFQLIELIFKRKVNPKVEAAIHAAGLILLFGVMIIITFKDIIFPVL